MHYENNEPTQKQLEKIQGGAMDEPQAEIGCVLGFLFLIFPGTAIIGGLIGCPILRIIYPRFGLWFDALSEPSLSFWQSPLSIIMVVGAVTMIMLAVVWVVICSIWHNWRILWR